MFGLKRYKGIFQKHKQGSLCQGKPVKGLLNLLQPRGKASLTVHEPLFLYLQNQVVRHTISKFSSNSKIPQFINCKLEMETKEEQSQDHSGG